MCALMITDAAPLTCWAFDNVIEASVSAVCASTFIHACSLKLMVGQTDTLLLKACCDMPHQCHVQPIAWLLLCVCFAPAVVTIRWAWCRQPVVAPTCLSSGLLGASCGATWWRTQQQHWTNLVAGGGWQASSGCRWVTRGSSVACKRNPLLGVL